MVTNSKAQEKACKVTSGRDRSGGIQAVEMMLEKEHTK
jgi:hypothetical protein